MFIYVILKEMSSPNTGESLQDYLPGSLAHPESDSHF